MFYDLFCELCARAGKTPSAVSKEIGFNRSTITMWKNSGGVPRGELLMKIAEYFKVPVDYLLSASSETEKAPILTKKDERDIARDLETIMSELENSESLMFDGSPLSDEAKESILAAMKLGLEAAKVKNKERFTPKKFRKE